MRVLITGGAGFIGCNAVHRFLQRGAQVIIYDNLSRRDRSVTLTGCVPSTALIHSNWFTRIYVMRIDCQGGARAGRDPP